MRSGALHRGGVVDGGSGPRRSAVSEADRRVGALKEYGEQRPKARSCAGRCRCGMDAAAPATRTYGAGCRVLREVMSAGAVAASMGAAGSGHRQETVPGATAASSTERPRYCSRPIVAPTGAAGTPEWKAGGLSESDGRSAGRAFLQAVHRLAWRVGSGSIGWGGARLCVLSQHCCDPIGGVRRVDWEGPVVGCAQPNKAVLELAIYFMITFCSYSIVRLTVAHVGARPNY